MYWLDMSDAQLDRCNTAAGRPVFSRSTVQHAHFGETRAVVADKATISEVVLALKKNPVDTGPDDGTLEWLNLGGLEEALWTTTQEPEDDGVLHGIQL